MFSKLIFNIIFCLGFHLASYEHTVDQNELNEIAVVNGYGYKYANLQMLLELTKKAINLPYSFEVPVFFGISSKNINNFLKEKANLDLAARWQSIINSHFENPKSVNEALISKVFSAKFLADCAALEREINEAFVVVANKNVSQVDKSFNVQGLDHLIDELRFENERLMVRSSGQEDTKELANAGGNVSVANVIPDAMSVLKAMGDVVAAYFGEKSLKQRLIAGDRQLFESGSILTPVLIQRMIQEKDPNRPTACGVMFSEHAEGTISQLTASSLQKTLHTSGITAIQAAYGHNEAVVNSLIAVDTYYVNNNLNSYAVIRPKHFRLVPSQESKVMEFSKNPPELIQRSSLSKRAVLSLKKFAIELEKFYLGPMDIEFVIDEQGQKIYIVQARPIVHDPHVLKPSYLVNATEMKGEKLQAIAIGVAGGSLRFCNNKHQVIVASTINKALENFKTKV